MSERQRTGGVDEIPLPDGVDGSLRLCGKRAIADGQFGADGVVWDTVVCLCQRGELEHRYPEYMAWLDAATADGADRAIWWPIHDLSAHSIDRTVPFVDDLVRRVRNGGSLLVHCAAGMGRAGTTAVAMLIRLGMTMDAALATVAQARPGAGPEVGSQLDLVRGIDRLRA